MWESESTDASEDGEDVLATSQTAEDVAATATIASPVKSRKKKQSSLFRFMKNK